MAAAMARQPIQPAPDDRPLLSLGAIALRRWRVGRNLTQFQLSGLLGLRYDKAARLERGYTRPTLVLATRMEDVCNIAIRLWLQPVGPDERRDFLASEPSRADRMAACSPLSVKAAAEARAYPRYDDGNGDGETSDPS